MNTNAHTELTIIVPTLNEEGALPLLLDDLASQHGVDFELVISDGASTDDTIAATNSWRGTSAMPLRLISGPTGRPGQIDRGAATARGRWLLILHADSRLPDHDALRTALDQLQASAARLGCERVAGRFRLRFSRNDGVPTGVLSLMEQKARLNRPGCIHGDQGLLLATARYRSLAPLSADPPMLAETRLADLLLTTGEMLLFPRDIQTSSRRFAVEGVAARQTINALIMNFATIDWPPFFTAALPLYQPQEKATTLTLGVFFTAIHDLLRREPPAERRRIWRATGAYVAANAWQLALRRDIRRAAPSESPSLTNLARYDRWLEPLINSTLGRRATQWLTWCWFQRIRLSP